MFKKLSVRRRKKSSESLSNGEEDDRNDEDLDRSVFGTSPKKKKSSLSSSSGIPPRENQKVSDIIRELFTIPVTPEFNVKTEITDTFSIIKEYNPTLVKSLEWTIFFLMGYLGLSYAWILVLILTYHTWIVSKKSSETRTQLSAQSSVTSEKDVFQNSNVSFESFPSWVAFPDFDRSEWINTVLKKIWPHLGPVSNTVAKRIIEPRINDILKRLNVKSVNLETISNFKLKEFILGSVPGRVGGIKAYDRNTDLEEIVMDVEVIYAGDARVRFSVQGWDCEINQVNFRAIVRVVFKPLMDALPIAGGLELYLISMPSLDYNLGGMAMAAEMPGISNIIRGILDKIIKKGFVWPNRLSLYLPLDSINNMEDKSYLLAQPSGVLRVEIVRGRDLVKKDLRGTSDPYVVASIGSSVHNFVEKYVSRDVNPEWGYECLFPIEEPSGHKLVLKVYDYDAGSEDDFMGEVSLNVETLLEDQEQWVTLQNVKHGDVLIKSRWLPSSPAPVSLTSTRAIVTLFLHCGENIGDVKRSAPYSRCEVRCGQEKRRVWVSSPRGPRHDPKYRQGCSFLSSDPGQDSLQLVVEDQRSGQSLGRVTIPLALLVESPGNRINHSKWSLEAGTGEDSSVTISAALLSY